MQDNNVIYGLMSTYNETIFLRQVSDPLAGNSSIAHLYRTALLTAQVCPRLYNS